MTPRSSAHLERLKRIQLVKKFPSRYGARCFFTVFATAVIGPYPEPDEFNPVHILEKYFYKVRFNIILQFTPGSS